MDHVERLQKLPDQINKNQQSTEKKLKRTTMYQNKILKTPASFKNPYSEESSIKMPASRAQTDFGFNDCAKRSRNFENGTRPVLLSSSLHYLLNKTGSSMVQKRPYPIDTTHEPLRSSMLSRLLGDDKVDSSNLVRL